MKYKIIEYSTKADKSFLKKLKETHHTHLIPTSMGIDNIDVKAVEKLGLKIIPMKDYCSSSVAEFAFFQLLWLTKKINKLQSLDQRKTHWHKGLELANMTCLIIGAEGNIGKKIHEIAKGFNMNVILFDKYAYPNDDDKRLKALLKYPEVIFLCIPLNDKTKDFFQMTDFALMQKKPFIINPSREGLLNNGLVGLALYQGFISGYACDDNPVTKIRGSNNCLFTPHVAAFTEEAQERKKRFIGEAIKSLGKTHLKYMGNEVDLMRAMSEEHKRG